VESYREDHPRTGLTIHKGKRAMTRWMALDVGDARIGVAVSDASGVLASPYTTLRARRDESETVGAIQRLVEETEAEALIVGLPISLDGQVHAQGERVRNFAERLRTHLSIPLTYWDERYSTVEAERLRAERYQDAYDAGDRRRSASRRPGGPHGKSRGKNRKHGQHEIDALAAAVILQDYLEHTSSEMKDTKDTMS
jgi:putative Holliday junction resolvase